MNVGDNVPSHECKSLPPLIIDNMIEVWPDLNEMLFQLIDITQALLTDVALKTDFVINRVQTWTIRWPGMNSGVTWRKYSTVVSQWHDGPLLGSAFSCQESVLSQ